MADGASHPLSILVVDDHPDSLELLARLLRRCGHAVKTASTVAGACAAIAQHRFDLLISDIGLPDGSGTDVMRTIHSTQGIPGIALTGHGEEHYTRACVEAGFAVRLLKPIVFSNLVEAMERALPKASKPIC
jgi:CheY-like chemotaxis protein